MCGLGRRESYVVSGAWQEGGLLVSEIFLNLCSSSRDLGPSCSVEPHERLEKPLLALQVTLGAIFSLDWVVLIRRRKHLVDVFLPCLHG